MINHVFISRPVLVSAREKESAAIRYLRQVSTIGHEVWQNRVKLTTNKVVLFTTFPRSTVMEETESGEAPDVFKGSFPDPLQLEWYKKYRENESKTMSAFKSLMFFVVFLLILGIVCYGNRDYHQYLMGNEIKALFPRISKASIYFCL